MNIFKIITFLLCKSGIKNTFVLHGNKHHSDLEWQKKDIIWVTNPFNVVLAKLVQQCTLNF